MRSTAILFLISAGALVNLACTASGSGDGACQRACGNRPIGGGNLKAVAYTDDLSYSCTAGQTGPQQTLYFMVYEDNTAAQEDSSVGAPVKLPERTPKGGIAFTPVVPAGLTLDSTSNDWCTDSCGIAEVKFTVPCGNKVTGSVQVVVPGMTTDAIPKTTVSFNAD